MIFYCYTWKGPKEHLLGCYFSYVCNFKTDLDNEEMERIVPTSKSNIYFPSKNIDHLLDYVDLWDWEETTATDINKEGDYALYKNKVKLHNNLKQFSSSYYIQEVYKPSTWQSRLVIILAVNSWRTRMQDYTLDYLDYTKFTYEDLERNKWAHKNYLKRLHILPNIYIWEKAIQLFKHDKYKPVWYKKEIDLYNKLIGE